MTIGADQPIKRAVIDIGGQESNAGLTFVAFGQDVIWNSFPAWASFQSLKPNIQNAVLACGLD